jgi:hypothetical protein
VVLNRKQGIYIKAVTQFQRFRWRILITCIWLGMSMLDWYHRYKYTRWYWLHWELADEHELYFPNIWLCPNVLQLRQRLWYIIAIWEYTIYCTIKYTMLYNSILQCDNFQSVIIIYWVTILVGSRYRLSMSLESSGKILRLYRHCTRLPDQIWHWVLGNHTKVATTLIVVCMAMFGVVSTTVSKVSPICTTVS